MRPLEGVKVFEGDQLKRIEKPGEITRAITHLIQL